MAEDTPAGRRVPTAEAVRLAADLPKVAKSVPEVVSGVSELVCFMVIEILIEQEKTIPVEGPEVVGAGRCCVSIVCVPCECRVREKV